MKIKSILSTRNNTPSRGLYTSLSAAVLSAMMLTSTVQADEHARLEALEAQVAELSAKKDSIKRSKGGSITFGGYIKADVRMVDGSAGYQDYWRGNNTGAFDTSRTAFNIKESRLNAKYTSDGVTGFIEFDMYGGGGNEIVSNSTSPRVRQAFIKTGKWTVGQTWSTLTPTMAFPEALDFGGAIVSEVFVRQPQVRYTHGNFAIAIEQPETWGDGDVGANSVAGGAGAVGNDADENTPDLIATYKFKGDWGVVQVGGLVRRVGLSANDTDETAVAINIGGKIKVGDRNDIRFQGTFGESGRYVGAGMVNDVVEAADGTQVVEETTALNMAYRHFWNDDWRSTVYWGNSQTDTTDYDRTHWGINAIRQLTPATTVGVELGNYDVGDAGIDSDYLQVSWKYAL